ncbi:DUF3828 domain-containing protein [[Enterobacter] lignolyticus]|uniref:DUF3828 domain-containing protein n=1 Tax=[Enterobacter] lignolyticus TaxID=1334193 RepID=A0A806XHC9_9ENTR|nr:DUF3828 domain-containing protein [[Enterobacter] lignolyticus]ALR78081.1 hypothetical protein AO703_17890 [[Enterobacter] lignolyticus]
MRYLSRWFLIVLATISITAFAQKPVVSLKETIEQIYKPYGLNTDPVSIYDTGENRIVSKRLAAVLQTDSELTAPGDGGALDNDPLCGCEDYDKLVVDNIQLLDENTQTATAIVRVRPSANNPQTNTISLSFVNENGRWLIDDIMNDDQSVYQLVVKSNHEQQEMLDGLQRPLPGDFIRNLFTSDDANALSWTLLLAPTSRKIVDSFSDMTADISPKDQEKNALPDIWNSNPLCGCDDPTTATLKDVQTKAESGGRTRVHARFTLANGAEKTQDIDLVNLGGRWLIDDYIDPQKGSLIQQLARIVITESHSQAH